MTRDLPAVGRGLRRLLTVVGKLRRFSLAQGLALLVLSLMIVAIVGFERVRLEYRVTHRQLLVKLAERLSITDARVLALLAPPPLHTEHLMDGRKRPEHPRILDLDLSGWSGREGPAPPMREKRRSFEHLKTSPPDPCSEEGLLYLTACWLVSGESSRAKAAIGELERFQHQPPDPNADDAGNAWEYALAYDLLAAYPGFDAAARRSVAFELRRFLELYLKTLDDDAPSLWHGRSALAASAWLCAVALDDSGDPQERSLVARAQGHFLDVIGALGVTEAWPEGYNYWINSRAFLIALAASAYVRGLVDSDHKADVLAIIEAAGLWPLYAMRPDHRVESLGDEGPRVDLKDETRRVIDVMAQTTKSPILGAFSSFLGALHKDSYYSGYTWGFWLFNEPALASVETSSKSAILEGLGAGLPKARLFGRNALNALYIHSDWTPTATFISCVAGHSFTHHGHYGAGHFTVFKGHPLAVNSANYHKGVFGSNRLHYSIRTISRNSLLILKPGEKVRPNRFFDTNIADGGQRILMPTGSAIKSLEQWRENLHAGAHYEGAELLEYRHSDGRYTYISSDLTGAYNSTRHDDRGEGGKVEKVQRELIYLHRSDRLIVHDRVITTDPSYQVKWILHTRNKPEAAALTVLRGEAADGILCSPAHSFAIANPPGFARVDYLLPERGQLRLVGGPNHRYYVETDADETRLDGRNLDGGAADKPWFDRAEWRAEINAPTDTEAHEYLVVITPRLDRLPQDPVGRAHSDRAGTIVELPETAIIFVGDHRHGARSYSIAGSVGELLLVGRLRGRTLLIDSSPAELGEDASPVRWLELPRKTVEATRTVTIE